MSVVGITSVRPMDVDIEKAKGKRQLMLCSPKGNLSLQTVDKIASGVLMHNGDGTVGIPIYKRELSGGREPWVILDGTNCTAEEIQILREWMARNAAMNGHAPPIPVLQRPRIVRERLLASMTDGLPAVSEKERTTVEKTIAQLRASLEDGAKGKRS